MATVPKVSSAQLKVVVERAQRRAAGRPIVVRADPASIDGASTIGSGVAVSATSSPLQIRRVVHGYDTDGGPVPVILTTLEAADLGDDLVARLAGRAVLTPNRWESVKELFGVRHITRDLARRPHLVDALIDAAPAGGYRATRSPILDVETAVGALLRALLDIGPDIDTLAAFYAWADAPNAANRLRHGNANVTEEIDGFLADRYGPGSAVVLTALRNGKAAELVPLSLVGALVHHPDAVDAAAIAVRLEFEIGAPHPNAEQWRAAGAAASQRLATADTETANQWLGAAEQVLRSIGGESLAHLSDDLRSGFGQRLAAIGDALSVALDSGDTAAVEAAIAYAAAHRRADSVRLDQARMAARLVRRGSADVVWGHRLSSAAAAYASDLAWLDRARTVVARGETVASLAEPYAALAARFDTARDTMNRQFGRLATAAGAALPDEVMGLEAVLDDVVAPVAAASPVVLVVFDGMGWPAFTEIARHIADQGFTAWRDPDGRVARPVYAALPTVTEVCRTSLFAGTVRRGDNESEQRAFRDHPALVAVSDPAKPPVIEHKAGLRSGGLDAVPHDLVELIGDPSQRVVAVVLNNIDERLKDVANPPDGWGLNELDPLRWILDAAQRAGRAVIVTADHGHVLDRNAEIRRAPGGGERWRPAATATGDDEVLVSGPRVGLGDGAVVVPVVEQLHYGARRNGYHGGLLPQEVLVPLAVYAEEAPAPDWEPMSFPVPSWWHPEAAARAVAVEPVVAQPAKPRKPPAAPTLFDDPAEVAAEASEVGSAAEDPGSVWAAATVAALADYRRPDIRLTDQLLTDLLRVLEAQGGQPMRADRLAELVGAAPTRIRGVIGQLQKLLNIDGYEVLASTGNEVRFDRALLDTQLGSD